jgi:hypothetical protein
MRIRTKVLGLVTAVALVAGGSLAAAAPASANAKVSGSTTIAIDSAVAQALSGLGVALNATEGGKVKKGKLVFPVTGVGDGFISHKGQLQITKDGGLVAAGNNPMIEYPTDQPLTSAIIEVDVPGIGATGLFTVTGIKAKEKVKKNVKKKVRVTTGSITGTLTVDAAQAGLINALLGTTLLTDGMKLGTTKTIVKATAKCKNKKCTK